MMKILVTSLVIAGAVVAAASAQQAVPFQAAPVERRAAVEGEMQAVPVGRARVAVESRVTKGAPYSAEAITEFVQALPDGNRITRKTVARTFRDSEGRTRREQGVSGAAGEPRNISISDPVANASFMLEPDTKNAWRTGLMMLPSKVGPGPFVPAAPVPQPGEPAPAPLTEAQRREIEAGARAIMVEGQAAGARGRGGSVAAGPFEPAQLRIPGGPDRTKQEDLGQRVIEGVMAQGTRSTTVIPAGEIGNDQPITIVSERWFSPELELTVLTKHSDPRSGETTYRLTNIVRGEQDRSLFEVPPDYTLKETGIRYPPDAVLRRR
jgi:hypothetical protein